MARCVPYDILGDAELALLLPELTCDMEEYKRNSVSAIHLVCQAGQVQHLAALMPLPLGSIPANWHSRFGTPLHVACWQGSAAVVEGLLDRGASLEVEDSRGYPALHVACENGHIRVASLLLDRGASVDQAGKVKCTPLHVASS